MPQQPSDAIIVCVGSRVDWQCADVIDRMTRVRSHPHWRFVMAEWLNGSYSAATVAWVTDCGVRVDEVYPLLAARVPLLVPESHPDLLQLCKTAQCGLFYHSPDDTEASLELLLSDTKLRTALGHNGSLHAVP